METETQKWRRIARETQHLCTILKSEAMTTAHARQPYATLIPAFEQRVREAYLREGVARAEPVWLAMDAAARKANLSLAKVRGYVGAVARDGVGAIESSERDALCQFCQDVSQYAQKAARQTTHTPQEEKVFS